MFKKFSSLDLTCAKQQQQQQQIFSPMLVLVEHPHQKPELSASLWTTEPALKAVY